MGRVRPVFIKKISHELIEKHADVFTIEFQKNKELMNQFVIIQSKLMRNRIAGYITHLVKEQARENEEKDAIE